MPPLRRSAPPGGAEQEADAGDDRERRVGPALERILDRLAERVGDIAERIDRLAPDLIEIQLPRLDVPDLTPVEFIVSSQVTGSTTFRQIEGNAVTGESLTAARSPSDGTAYVGTLGGLVAFR